MNYKKKKIEPEIFKFMIKSEYYLYRVGKRTKQNLREHVHLEYFICTSTDLKFGANKNVF